MVHSKPIFGDCLVIFLPKLCVFFAFKVPISDIRDTGEVFPFAWGGGAADTNDAF